jgi:hypothetical protein
VHLLLWADPVSGTAGLLAGTTVEGLRDGPALDGWLAQPSGLAVDGERLWFVDSETSALRWLDGGGGLHTAVGEGLFDFGHVDGPPAVARMQHPLGVSVLPDGSIAVCDTFNGALRRWDGHELTTIADGLLEPSGAVVAGDRLVVVESAAHRLTALDLGGVTSGRVTKEARGRGRPPMTVRSGAVNLDVVFTPAPGRVLDDRFGPATRLSVSASPPELLVAGAGDGVELSRRLQISDGLAAGVLHVTAQAASCDHDPGIENPACYLARQDWGVPVVVDASGERTVRLVLLG